jgi:hypothetical protein
VLHEPPKDYLKIKILVLNGEDESVELIIDGDKNIKEEDRPQWAFR